MFCLQNLPCLVSFGACMESVWRFEQRTFYIGSLRVKFILAPTEFTKMSLTHLGVHHVLQEAWRVKDIGHYNVFYQFLGKNVSFFVLRDHNGANKPMGRSMSKI